MSDLSTAIAALVTAAFGLAILAVIVSKNANTAGVISAASSGLGAIIEKAVSPVTGGGGVGTSGGTTLGTDFGGILNSFTSGNFG